MTNNNSLQFGTCDVCGKGTSGFDTAHMSCMNCEMSERARTGKNIDQSLSALSAKMKP